MEDFLNGPDSIGPNERPCVKLSCALSRDSPLARGTGRSLDGSRKQHIESLITVPLLIIDDLGMRKLLLTAAEELLEIIMRRYERASTKITSNRPVDDWAETAGRQCRGYRHARPPAASWARSEMRPTQLARLGYPSLETAEHD